MNTDKIVDWFLSRAPSTTNSDKRIKRLFVSFCLACMVPVAVIFGCRDVITGRMTEGMVVLGIGIVLSTLIFVLNRTNHYIGTIRTFAFLLSVALTYELCIGGGEGGAILWFFVLPSSIIFLLGFKEGIIWNAALALHLSILLFGGFGHGYPLAFAIRLVAVYTIITLLAGSLEILREKYLRQMEREKEALRNALDEIRQLKGMVPICASCKKIRNDNGFWTHIETYIKEHADVEFSHGICPECAAQHFPKATRARAVERHTGAI